MFQPLRSMRSMNNQSTTHGLVNRPGENNCFINSVIQLLWHTDAFRQSFLKINYHYPCAEFRTKLENKRKGSAQVEEEAFASLLVGPETAFEDDAPFVVAKPLQPKRCLVCDLSELFLNYKFSEDSTIPPDIVRQSLSNAFEEGKMHSALDCLEAILEELNKIQTFEIKPQQATKLMHLERKMRLHPAKSSDKDFLHHLDAIKKKTIKLGDFFTYATKEYRKCGSCSEKGKEFESSSKFFHVAVSSLLDEEISTNFPSFSGLVHNSMTAGLFSCPKDNVFCAPESAHLEIELKQVPEIICLSFNWASEFVEKGTIESLMGIISLDFNLKETFDVYPRISDTDADYQIRALVAYYGKHYTSYVFHSGLKLWFFCNDEKVRPLGLWEDVIKSMIDNKNQVELIVYGKPVNGDL